MKKRVFSGIRATGRLHLGNYLGAVKGMIALQDNPSYETFYAVVDLHAMTTPFEPKKLKENIRSVVLDYLACGLDPEKSSIFVQSQVPEHVELAYLFSTVISVSRMRHLPTYKEKVKLHPKNVTMSLLNYPILMAADILIYKAEAVPVGDDQLPHLEVAREVARKMNAKYGLDFPEPKQFATKGHLVPSLFGQGKMSKSVEGSYINLTDNLQSIRKKLASVPTDVGKGKKIPTTGGVVNLLTFVELFQGKKKRVEYERKYLGKGIRYSELKEGLAKDIFKELKPIQEKRERLSKKQKYVDEVLEKGAEKASEIARKTLKQVKERMGI
jgi:tryptophanyl-tRNA synthetase